MWKPGSFLHQEDKSNDALEKRLRLVIPHLQAGKRKANAPSTEIAIRQQWEVFSSTSSFPVHRVTSSRHDGFRTHKVALTSVVICFRSGLSSLLQNGPVWLQVVILTKQKPHFSLLKAKISGANNWNQVWLLLDWNQKLKIGQRCLRPISI